MRATEWLKLLTKRSAPWWMAACQQAISKASKSSTDPNHDETDTAAFLNEVARLVCNSMPVPDDNGVKYDGNMRAAAVMSVVLALWYGRLNYAKAHDPARPVSLRMASYDKWLNWVLALTSVAVDESEDATYFPGQKWDYLFGHEATDGDFV